uniref:Uncharacterized protein n=1 Tax=Alexandrium monilatum TaxID=311494 RepID=A0A7S4VFR3_9DINO
MGSSPFGTRPQDRTASKRGSGRPMAAFPLSSKMPLFSVAGAGWGLLAVALTLSLSVRVSAIDVPQPEGEEELLALGQSGDDACDAVAETACSLKLLQRRARQTAAQSATSSGSPPLRRKTRHCKARPPSGLHQARASNNDNDRAW